MWPIYSFAYAFWTSISNAILKKLLASLDPVATLFTGLLLTIPFTFLIILLTGGFPQVNSTFFISILIAAVIDVVAFLASIYALKLSPISLIAPIAAFTPVFTAIFAIFILGEVPSLRRFLGILIVIFGAYLLNIKSIKQGFLEPIKKLISDKGVQLFFAANFLWAITPVFQKKAILNTFPSTPLLGSFADFSFVVILLAPFAIIRAKKTFSKKPSLLLIFVFLGIFGALAQLAAYTSFALANVAYVSSIFKLSSLFMIFWGYLFFKEKNIKEKLLGGVVMIIGAIMISV